VTLHPKRVVVLLLFVVVVGGDGVAAFPANFVFA